MLQHKMENATRNYGYPLRKQRGASRSNLDQDVQMEENTFNKPHPVQQLQQSFSQIYISGNREEYSMKSKNILTHRSNNLENQNMSNLKENGPSSFRDSTILKNTGGKSSGPQSTAQQYGSLS